MTNCCTNLVVHRFSISHVFGFGYLLALILFPMKDGLSQSTTSTITREAAAKMILSKIIVPPALDHDVTAYLSLEPLQQGDTITPFLDGDPFIIQTPTWFCWIDDQPRAFFAHSCRFVFIAVKSGSMTIREVQWWPELNGVSLWMDQSEKKTPELIIYSDKHLNAISDE